jgi:site-specific recombinase XerD
MKPYCTSQGNWQLNFVLDGKRYTLYLGRRYNASSAERVADVVYELASCRTRNEKPSAELLRRVSGLPQRVRASLDKFGLVDNCFGMTLGELFEKHLFTKSFLKKKTQKFYKNSYKHFEEYFGLGRAVSSVSKADARLFLDFMSTKLAPCTIHRLLKSCKTIFSFAVEIGIISDNPFQGMRRGDTSNSARQFYVERAIIDKLLLHCENNYERLLLVLSRFGGLRIPSEIRKLKFGDFFGNVIRISEDTKTGFREVPFLNEIKEVFQRLHGSPDDFVFPAEFRSDAGSWFILSKIIKRAGITRWDKLFVNMRSSFITDMVALGYDEKTLDSIFGNSAEVRKMHYIQFQKEQSYKKVLEDNQMVFDFIKDIKKCEDIDLSLQKIVLLRNLLVSQNSPLNAMLRK